MLYGFGFQLRNISTRIIYGIQGLTKRNLLWGASSINSYCDLLIKDNTQFILGIGLYSGKSRDKIHIETAATNTFKRNMINPSGQSSYSINPFLKPASELSILSETIGNGYCNFVSYKVCELIYTKEISSRYTFLHVHKSMDEAEVIKEIESMLKLKDEY